MATSSLIGGKRRVISFDVPDERYYADQMRILWRKYGHKPDDDRTDFDWQSWKAGKRNGDICHKDTETGEEGH